MRIMEIFHLDDMTPGQRAEVLALRTESRMRRRLLDLGLVPGTRVECVGQSPGGDPRRISSGGQRWPSAARTPGP